VRIRRATDADQAALVALCGQALGWTVGEPNDELFDWKHRRSPFGRSPMWLAETDDGPVALRAMLRWELATPRGDVVRAVRAVDTATRADHRGRGLFRSLTLGAVEALTAEGVDLVFNTPNERSRPGYLAMGWQVVGRVPVAVALPSVRALPRLRAARGPARKWSSPTSAGRDAGEVLGDPSAAAALVGALAPRRALATPRTPAYLRWRYVDGPVAYRTLALGADPAEGLAVFRLRRRGGSTEASVAELLVPDDGAEERRRRLVGAVLRATRPDHLLVACTPPPSRPRSLGSVLGRWPAVRAPGLGPILTSRPLAGAACPAPADWDLDLGDVELF
jgi:hypothetical protein